MKFKPRTKVARNKFSDAAEILHADRQDFFSSFGLAMVSHLKSGKEEALWELAKSLQKHGIYSSKASPGAIETMLLKRLHSQYGGNASWRTFVSRTVGPKWFDGGRAVKRRPKVAS